MSYALKKGTTSKILLVYALDSADIRLGKTALNSRTPDSSAAYIREGEAQVRRIPLIEGKLGDHRAGSFVEIDSKFCLAFTSLAFPTRCWPRARKPLR